jgi:hypothetical protein
MQLYPSLLADAFIVQRSSPTHKFEPERIESVKKG